MALFPWITKKNGKIIWTWYANLTKTFKIGFVMSRNNLFSKRKWQKIIICFLWYINIYVVKTCSVINILKCCINIARGELNFWKVLFLVVVQISLNSVVESTSNKNRFHSVSNLLLGVSILFCKVPGVAFVYQRWQDLLMPNCKIRRPQILLESQQNYQS